MVRCAKQAGINEVALLTNGLLVSRTGVEGLVGYVDCIAVAFDGWSQDCPAYLRGCQNFNKLVSTIKAVKTAGIEARILPTVHGMNVEDLPHYQELAQRLGASLSYSLLTGPGDSLGSCALSDAQLRCLARFAHESGSSLDDDGAAPSLAARRSCGAGTRTLSVDADGSVYPCHMLHNGRFLMGNAFTDTKGQVMGGTVAQKMRALDVGRFDRCGDCNVRWLCGGGCRARALFDTGSIEGCDPYCALSVCYYDLLINSLESRFNRKEYKDVV